jgi:hypothetical protein
MDESCEMQGKNISRGNFGLNVIRMLDSINCTVMNGYGDETATFKTPRSR